MAINLSRKRWKLRTKWKALNNFGCTSNYHQGRCQGLWLEVVKCLDAASQSWKKVAPVSGGGGGGGGGGRTPYTFFRPWKKLWQHFHNGAEVFIIINVHDWLLSWQWQNRENHGGGGGCLPPLTPWRRPWLPRNIKFTPVACMSFEGHRNPHVKLY